MLVSLQNIVHFAIDKEFNLIMYCAYIVDISYISSRTRMMGLLTCLPVLAIWEFRLFGQTSIACAWRQTKRCMSISSRRLKRTARQVEIQTFKLRASRVFCWLFLGN